MIVKFNISYFNNLFHYSYKSKAETGTVPLGGDFVGGLAVSCSDLETPLLMKVMCFDIRTITGRVVYINAA